MGDLGDTQLVKPSDEVEKRWLMVQIQERKSKIARFTQDIEDLTQGKIVALEAQILLAKQELQKFENDLQRFSGNIEASAI
jgi:predicted  nucleic acid-binding Zn-ribbon protein